MTVPFSNEIFLYAVPGGELPLGVKFETFAGSGFALPVSGTTITITSVSSGSVIIGPTSAGIISPDGAGYTYPWAVAATVTPGDYAVLWSATGPSGPLAIAQTVTVSAPPATTPGPGVYASVAQYQAWSGDLTTPSPLLTSALRRASEVIDLYLVGAVYETSANGMPTEASTIDAFMRAACAQCAFEIAQNDPSHVKSQYASTSMGGVSQTRAGSAMNQMLPPLAPQAAAIMRVTGILPSAPLINW